MHIFTYQAMADSLTSLKERYFMDGLCYIGAPGVINFSQCFSDMVDVFEKEYNLKDPNIIEKLRLGTGNMLALNEQCHDPNKECCTVDEWVEVCCWFILKRPRIFKKRFSDWVRSVFEALDLDQNGYITEEQFAFLYRPTIRGNDPAWISRAFKSLGADKTGKVSKK